MAKCRHDLPMGKGKQFLLDGGLETTLVFLDGIDLPCFASYPLIAETSGRTRLRDYYRQYANIAIKANAGFIFESVGWRANADWGAELGHNAEDLAAVNRESIRLMDEIRTQIETDTSPMVLSGCSGPRGDGYQADTAMTVDEVSRSAPVYYMINCAHPDHFADILEPGAAWMDRLKGIRANASRMSHEELDVCTELDAGNPVEFGSLHATLTNRYPNFSVLGGCCGTDHRHVGEVFAKCAHTSIKAS